MDRKSKKTVCPSLFSQSEIGKVKCTSIKLSVEKKYCQPVIRPAWHKP